MNKRKKLMSKHELLELCILQYIDDHTLSKIHISCQLKQYFNLYKEFL